VDIGFSTLHLPTLDTSGCDVIACGLFEDDRPMRGLAAVIDYRLAGRLSTFLRTGELTGRANEAFLFPPRPRLTAEKLVVFGWGRISELDEDAVERAMRRMVTTLAGLGAKRALVELPGRQRGLCDADRSAILLFRTVEDAGADLHFQVVEDDEGKRTFFARIEEEKKRARRVM
jgi:hypothetical protein